MYSPQPPAGPGAGSNPCQTIGEFHINFFQASTIFVLLGFDYSARYSAKAVLSSISPFCPSLLHLSSILLFTPPPSSPPSLFLPSPSFFHPFCLFLSPLSLLAVPLLGSFGDSDAFARKSWGAASYLCTTQEVTQHAPVSAGECPKFIF